MIQTSTTTNAPAAIGPYSQAVSYNSLLFVSGQLPIDPKTGALVQDTIITATRQVLDNIEAILKAAGSDWDRVLRVDIFLTDLSLFPIVNEEYARRFQKGHLPARQTIEVSRLPKDAPLEISCIAAR